VVDCPTSGGSVILLKGLNFGSDSALVLIGTSPCTGVVHDPNNRHREITCISPSGTGVNRYEICSRLSAERAAADFRLALSCPLSRPVLILQGMLSDAFYSCCHFTEQFACCRWRWSGKQCELELP
jgi:hypothetical protein